MNDYPVITTELTRRKWGMPQSRQRLEMASKSVMVNSNGDLRLIGQVFKGKSEGNLRRVLKMSSDGFRTIFTSRNRNGAPIVIISHNYPIINDHRSQSRNVRYTLPHTNGLNDFVFNNNDGEILYSTGLALYCLDLETGKIRRGPRGIYNRGLSQSHRNHVMSLDMQQYILKRVNLNNIKTRTTYHWTRRIECRNLCGFQDPIHNYFEYFLPIMDVNMDHSKLAIVGADYRLCLYDLRRFNSFGPWWSGEPLARLGHEECLFSMDLILDHYLSYLKFSPKGSKIALGCSSTLYVYHENKDSGSYMDKAKSLNYDGGPLSWFDDDNLCFVQNGMVVNWNVNTDKICHLVPGFADGVYVHPKYPLIANFQVDASSSDTEHLFKLWTV